MLGFMGTVIGMIGAFDAIEAAGDISPSLVEISPSMDGIFSCQVFGKNCLHHAKNSLGKLSQKTT